MPLAARDLATRMLSRSWFEEQPGAPPRLPSPATRAPAARRRRRLRGGGSAVSTTAGSSACRRRRPGGSPPTAPSTIIGSPHVVIVARVSAHS